MKSFKRIIPYLVRYRKDISLAIITVALVSVTDLLIIQQIGAVIDQGIAAHSLNRVVTLSLIMLGLALLSMVLTFFNTWYTTRATEYVAAYIRDLAFRNTQRFSFSNLDKLQTGELLIRLTSDVNILKNALLMTLRMVIRAPIMLVGSLMMLVLTSPKLSLVLVVAIPVTMALALYFSQWSEKMYKVVQAMLDRVNTIMQENIAGVQVVKAFVRADYEIERFGQASSEYMERSIQVNQLVAVLMPSILLVLNISLAAIIWFGGDLVIGGELTSGELVAFSNYLTTAMIPVGIMSLILPQLFAAQASIERIFEIVDLESTITEKADAKILKDVQGRIAFENVSFYYNGANGQKEPVLTHVSFTVEPGKTVAILGATGSGKTSLVNLIPRFYDVSAGRVTIDGQDVRDVTLASLRAAIGICLQETVLFSGSIRDNIRFGNPGASDKQVEAAAQVADAPDFILNKAEGYHTVLGQRGAGLSGGQRQRVAIARALVHQPRILILDDSTSAVDAVTESKIQEALMKQESGMTRIIVAQRISTVLTADKIVVLENGRVSGVGTHAELLASNRVYQEIYESQLGNNTHSNNENGRVKHV